MQHPRLLVEELEHGHTPDHIIARSAPPHSEPNPSRRRYSWSELIRRVFALEVLICERCLAPTRIIADTHSPSAIRAILECLGLPARAPPVGAARGEEFDAEPAEDDSRAPCEHDREATSGEG